MSRSRLPPLPEGFRVGAWGRAIGVLVGFAVAAGDAGPSLAQAVVRVVPGKGEIGADSRLHWTAYGRADETSTSELAAWVALPFGGVLLDPRLFTWRLTLRPEIRRSTFSAAPEALSGRGFGWSGGFHVLAGRPLSLAVQGGSHSAFGEGGFGTRTDYETSTLNATLASANPAFPLQLTWSRQANLSSFQNLVAGTDVATSYDTRSLRLSGASSKASLLVDHTQYDDRLGPADYDSWTVLVGHTARWGKGSSLESSYDLTDQSGMFAFARRQWTERVRLQHTHAVASVLTWRKGTTETGGRGSELTSLTYDVSASIGRTFTAGVSYGRHGTAANGAREVGTTISPRGSLSVHSAGGMFLNASGSIGLDRRQRTGGADLTLPVINEPHPITASRRFLLDLPDPDPLSIVVRNADQTITYREGVDYEVTVSGASVRIDILPDSRVALGATVLVSYRARLPGDFEDEARLTDIQVTAGVGALRLRHSSNVRDARQPRAVSSARGRADFAHSTTALDYQTDGWIGRLVLNAALNRRDRLDARTAELSLGVTLASQPARAWHTSVGLYWSRTETNELEARSLSGQSSIVWLASGGLRFQLILEGLVWDQPPEAPIRELGGSLSADWRLGQLEATLRVEREVRTDGGRFGTSRVSIRTRRRF